MFYSEVIIILILTLIKLYLNDKIFF